MSECLGQDGAYELEINYLMNSRSAKVLERIKKIDISISNFSTFVRKIEYAQQDDPNLLPVKSKFIKKIANNSSQSIFFLLTNGIVSAAAISALTASGLGPVFAFMGGVFSGWSAASFMKYGMKWIRKLLINDLECLPELS